MPKRVWHDSLSNFAFFNSPLRPARNTQSFP
jgi:hypothetical protein